VRNAPASTAAATSEPLFHIVFLLVQMVEKDRTT
jgi:hypothetical protein